MSIKEYRLEILPNSYNLDNYLYQDWHTHRNYNTRHYVMYDLHPYVCIASHVSSNYNIPGIGRDWADNWDRALLKSSNYFTGVSDDLFEYVTDDSSPPLVTLVSGGGTLDFIDPRNAPYNCIGDGDGLGGGTNCYSGMLRAIQDSILTGKYLDGGGKIYKIDDKLTENGRTVLSIRNMTRNLVWRNITFDFSSCSGINLESIGIEDRAFGVPIYLTADANSYSSIIPLSSAASLTVGDILVIKSAQNYDPATTGLINIASISGNNITSTAPLLQSFLVSDSAHVQKLDKRFIPDWDSTGSII